MVYVVTENLIWPILLHASTDSSIFLLSAHPQEDSLAAIASLGNMPVVVVGLVSIIFIRGRVQAKAAAAS